MSKPRFERPLHPGARERIVGDREEIPAAADFRQRRQVGQLEQRIRRRLDPDDARLRPDGGGDLRRVGHVDESERQTCAAAPDTLEQTVRAAVQVVARDDVRARVDEFEDRGDRRHARSERERLLASFEVGNAALQRPSRRIVRTAVIETLVHAGAFLHERRRGVDRRHDRARRWVGCLAGVNGACADALFLWRHDGGLGRRDIVHCSVLRR